MRALTTAPSRALVTISIVLVALVLLLASSVQATGSDPVELDAYKVGAGDTLWTIAGDVTPEGGDVRDTISVIKRLNRLDGSLIRPGQVLEVPSAP